MARMWHTAETDEEIYPCPACGYVMYDETGGYFICRVCGWEDCSTSCEHFTGTVGPNVLSLLDYQHWFAFRKKLGLSHDHGYKLDPKWRPLDAGDIRRNTVPPPKDTEEFFFASLGDNKVLFNDVETARAAAIEMQRAHAASSPDHFYWLRNPDPEPGEKSLAGAGPDAAERPEPAAAIEEYERAVEAGEVPEPDRPYYFQRYGECWYEDGELERAIGDFSTSIRLDPERAAGPLARPEEDDVIRRRGHAYLDLGDLDRALADFEEAVRQQPDYALAVFSRGLALYALERLDEAIADFDLAIGLQPEFAEAYCNRGIICERLDRFEDARCDFKIALLLGSPDPDFFETVRTGLELLNRQDEGKKKPYPGLRLVPASPKGDDGNENDGAPGSPGLAVPTDFEKLVGLGLAFASEQEADRLMERIVVEAQRLAHADGGILYLRTEEDSLAFEILRMDSLDVAFGGTTGKEVTFPPIPMVDPDTQKPNHANIASAAALTGETINIPDIYDSVGLDFSGTKAFDKGAGYRTESTLAVPMTGARGRVVGVLHLTNALDPETGETVPFSNGTQHLIETLATQAVIALANLTRFDQHRTLIHHLIEQVMAAVDEDETPYGGNPCRKAVELANMLTEAAHESPDAPFASFILESDDEGYEIRLAAHLWHFGRVGSRTVVSPDTADAGEAPDDGREISVDEVYRRLQRYHLRTGRMFAYQSFPAELAGVGQYLTGHMDPAADEGAQEGLNMDDAPLPARIFQFADIFVALTITAHPKRDSLSAGDAVEAMSRLADEGRIDGDIFRLFLVSGVWRDYAERFLEAHKIDDIDIDAYT